VTKFACIFPGQGSQAIGMLRDLSVAHSVVRETFEEAADNLAINLWSLVMNGPEADLNRTEITQPVMLTAGVAAWRAWCAAGGARPAMMAGHSLGEYTALVCAGALNFGDAVLLVRARGRLMQAAVPEEQGAMAAILGLEGSQVTDICARAAQGNVVSAVNFNAPNQIVIAGDTKAVMRAIALATELGAKRAVRLPVSVPAHCMLMLPAAERLATDLVKTSVKAPEIPVLHNADAACHREPAVIRDILVRQLFSPVRWVDTVQAFAARGMGTIVEMGPGKVLAGLTRRIDKKLQSLCVYDPNSLAQALAKCFSPGDNLP
jgi:[acyl-carrier-protein] S-malonyltransferase